MNTNPKLLFLILASDNDNLYVEFQNCWKILMGIYPEIDYYFIKYRLDIDDDIIISDHNIYFKGNESLIPGCLNKTIYSLRYFYNKLDTYDYICRPNVSSYIYIPNYYKYISTLPKNNVYSGTLLYSDSIPFCEGTCITMTPDIAKYITNNINLNTKYVDDVAIGKLLMNKINIIPLDIRHGVYIRDKYCLYALMYDKDDYFLYRIKTDNINERKILDPRIYYGLIQIHHNIQIPYKNTLNLAHIVTVIDHEKISSEKLSFFINMWKLLFPHINISIYIVSDILPNSYLLYQNYIKLIAPLDNINKDTMISIIKLIIPSIIDDDGGIFTTDINYVPMNRDFYIKSITNIINNNFVIYLPSNENHKYNNYYNLASKNIWQYIFNIYSIDQFNDKIKSILLYINQNNIIDIQSYLQNLLYDSINKLDINNIIQLKNIDTKFTRLTIIDIINNKGINNFYLNLINNFIFTDFEILPDIYHYFNDIIYKLIYKNIY